MIQDVGLRWLVTLLFAFSAAVCVRGMVAGRHSPPSLISHSLHALMAIAMAVMAWPRGADLPARAPMIFFALAAVWFVAITITGRVHRGANGYHTLMMMAMAWMYAAMGGLALPKGSAASGHDMGMDMAATSGHAGHAGHAGHGSRAAAGHTGTDSAWWIGGLNWVCAVGFGVAAAFWFYRLVTSRLQPASGTAGQSLGILCQFAMAAGMAIMFAVML
jgi:hypothetical protein